MGSSLRFTTVVVAFLVLSIVLLDLPTEVKGAECIDPIGYCHDSKDCERHCKIFSGDEMVKVECKVPPGEKRVPFAVCFCYSTCDRPSQETI